MKKFKCNDFFLYAVTSKLESASESHQSQTIVLANMVSIVRDSDCSPLPFHLFVFCFVLDKVSLQSRLA